MFLLPLARRVCYRQLGGESTVASAFSSAAFKSQQRKPSTLVLVEHAKGAVLPATWSALAAAKELKDHPISFLVVAPADADADAVEPGKQLPREIVDALRAHGPQEILVARSSIQPEPLAPLLARVLTERPFTHMVAASSAFARSLLPRVAALVDVAPVADVVEIKGPDVFVRPIYAGNALCTLRSGQPLNILAVRATAFPPPAAAKAGSGVAAAAEQAPIVDAGCADPAHTALSELVKETPVVSDRPELGNARVVVAGGRALKSEENFKMLYDLADKLGGAVGASRAAVDAGYADNSLQIGQTGKVVAPSLYIGVGISGAIQHLAGMKDSKVIVAINSDAEAPIFQIADYGLVANLFDAVPELTKKL